MTDPVRILLPFSECKVPGGKTEATLKTRENALRDCLRPILDKRLEALAAFKNTTRGSREGDAVAGLSGAPRDAALRVNRSFESSALAPVFERNGRSFVSAVDPASLALALRRRLEREVFFICPLLGVLRPRDMVPDYRVSAGANLQSIGSLHKFWKSAVTKALNRALKGTQVFSFLPTRLGALWEPDGREAGITVVRFSRVADGKALGETAAVPRLSGEAIRFIFESDARSAADMTRFRSSAGHAYSVVHSEGRGRVRCINFVCHLAGSRSAPAG